MSGIQDMVNSPITLDRNLNETIKNVFLLYNGISEQYHDAQILEKIKFLIPGQILQLTEDNKLKPKRLLWVGRHLVPINLE